MADNLASTHQAENSNGIFRIGENQQLPIAIVGQRNYSFFLRVVLHRDFFRAQTAFDAFCRWAMTRPPARLQPWRRHRPSRMPPATPHAAGEGVQARANARASNRALRPWRSPTLPVLPIDTGAAALHFPPEAPFPRPVGAPCRSRVAQLDDFEIFFCRRER